MSLQLSVLLPVRNGQDLLGENVHCLLETLPDLTGRFEVLIADDGSTDATCEIAFEFSRSYPQIRAFRTAQSIGWAATVDRYAFEARGEFIMIHCGGKLDHHDIAGLWRLRQSIHAAEASGTPAPPGGARPPHARAFRGLGGAAAARAREGGGKRLGIHARAPRSNLLMIHRSQLEQLEQSLAQSQHTGWPASAPHRRHHGPAPTKAPTFLTRLREFARSE